MSKLQRLVLNHKNGTSEFIIKDENAPAFDEAQKKTDEEKAQARANIGTNTLIVTIDGDTASHTPQQIYDHVQAGGAAVLNNAYGRAFVLTGCSAELATFDVTYDDDIHDTCIIYDTGEVELKEYRHFLSNTTIPNQQDIAQVAEDIVRSNSIYTPVLTAEVGQILRVKAVNEDGNPTAWEVADLTSGEEESTYELLESITISDTDAGLLEIVRNNYGALRQALITIYTPTASVRQNIFASFTTTIGNVVTSGGTVYFGDGDGAARIKAYINAGIWEVEAALGYYSSTGNKFGQVGTAVVQAGNNNNTIKGIRLYTFSPGFSAGTKFDIYGVRV